MSHFSRSIIVCGDSFLSLVRGRYDQIVNPKHDISPDKPYGIFNIRVRGWDSNPHQSGDISRKSSTFSFNGNCPAHFVNDFLDFGEVLKA